MDDRYTTVYTCVDVDIYCMDDAMVGHYGLIYPILLSSSIIV